MKKLSILTIGILFTFGLSNLKAQTTGTFEDTRDGKIYKTVQISEQVWFAENLAFKADSGSWAYNNDESNVAKYGYLYNWETAQNVCPDGYHLPSDDEWKTLEQTLGMTGTEDDRYIGENRTIGGKLKSTKRLWESPNTDANNMSYFEALPAGVRIGYAGKFNFLGIATSFWTNTPSGNQSAWYRGLGCRNGNVTRDINYHIYGYSVRCIKN